jgi:hypothetical protein
LVLFSLFLFLCFCFALIILSLVCCIRAITTKFFPFLHFYVVTTKDNINKTGNKTKFDLQYDNVYSKLFTISKFKCSSIGTVCVSSCHEHLYVYVIFGFNLNRKFVVFSVFKKNIKIWSFLDLRVLWFRYLIFQVFFF